MEIVWVESDALRRCEGHGVNFFALRESRRDELVAALEGFDWLHGRPETVRIGICAPTADLDRRFLDDARVSIERFVREPGDLNSHVSDSIWAGING